MSNFHQSKAWTKLAKEHKTLRCACDSKTDIESAHYLPQKRFPLMRLWRVNLYHACKVCNGNLGNRIKWGIRAALLLMIYPILWAVHYMIKFLTYLITFLIIAIIVRFMYIDYHRGPFDTTITGEVWADVIHYYQEIQP